MASFVCLGGDAPFVGRKANRSRYIFKNWAFNSEGKRIGAQEVHPIRRDSADLVCTAYANPAKGTNTVYSIGFDLDAHRASAQWKTKQGKLKWHCIRRLLAVEAPQFLQHVFAVVRSTGGKGLAVYVAISPMELSKATKSCQKVAKAVQAQGIKLFNHFGMGADPAAIGLSRDFCNWHNADRRVYWQPDVLRFVQSGRDSVCNEVLAEFNALPYLGYQRKRDRKGLLHHDARVETKLARLYRYLLEETEDTRYTDCLSIPKIISLTGLSAPYVRKLSGRVSWLHAERLTGREGWQLTLWPTIGLSERVAQLLSLDGQSLYEPSATTPEKVSPKSPGEVEDGERNTNLYKAALTLKFSGVIETTALGLVYRYAQHIPEAQYSRNCKMVPAIVRSIYGRHEQNFAARPGCAPLWLLGDSDKQPQLRQEVEAPSSQKETKFKKGRSPSYPVWRKVAFTGFIGFEGGWYSVPEEYVGAKLKVRRWKNKIVAEDGDRVVARHPWVRKRCKSRMHIRSLRSCDKKVLDELVLFFQAVGPASASLVARMIAEQPFANYKKILHLKSISFDVGRAEFERVAQIWGASYKLMLRALPG